MQQTLLKAKDVANILGIIHRTLIDRVGKCDFAIVPPPLHDPKRKRNGSYIWRSDLVAKWLDKQTMCSEQENTND